MGLGLSGEADPELRTHLVEHLHDPKRFAER
jgi:hypothetical protein